MSRSESPPQTDDQPEDIWQRIRDNDEKMERLGERDDEMGAVARYMLSVARGEMPDPYDCRLSGLPNPREWQQ